MSALVAAALSGLVFGIGLALSQMTNPAKVMGFLDFFGSWDPSLAFVMLGAIGVHLPLLRWLSRQSRPLFAAQFSVQAAQRIDSRLIVGATIFGVGWGVSGYCPAPAIASSGTAASALVLLISMSMGIALHEWWSSRYANCEHVVS